MSVLGNGLNGANQCEDALSVQEAEFFMLRRIGAPDDYILALQCNLASTYQALGRHEEALQMDRDTYRGRLKLDGEEYQATLRAASNYAANLINLQRFGRDDAERKRDRRGGGDEALEALLLLGREERLIVVRYGIVLRHYACAHVCWRPPPAQ